MHGSVSCCSTGNGNVAPRTGGSYIDGEDYLLFGLRYSNVHAVPSVLQAGL